MKRELNKQFHPWIIGFIAGVLATVVIACLVTGMKMQPPESEWKEEVYAVEPAISTYPDLKLDEIEANTNLANPLTEEAKDKQSDDSDSAVSEESKEDSSDENNSESDKKNHSNLVNDVETSNEDSGETENSEFETKYEDLAEDSTVQEDILVSDLMKEIGLDNPEQIIYVRNITGVGESSILQSINGAYAALLSTKGTTIIQVKYKNADGDSQLYVKKINYIRPEGSTPTEKQPLIRTNLKENGIYNQPTLNFDVWITDYRGKSLGYSSMEVLVNGRSADYIGEMNRQTYSTELRTGSNTIEITVKDEYQYTVRKSYTVFYESGKGTITISLEAGTIGIKYLVEPKQIDVESGVSLSYVLDEYLKSEGITYSYTGNLDDGFYLAKIHKKNLINGYKIPSDLASKIKKDELMFDEDNYESLDDLGEFDFCQGSGWMYSINGLYSSYGFNKAYVQDGDVVRIRFTLAYGKDINGYDVMAGSYGKLDSYGKEW